MHPPRSTTIEPDPPSCGAIARECLALVGVAALIVVTLRVGPARAMAGGNRDEARLSEQTVHLMDECLNPNRVVRYNKPRG